MKICIDAGHGGKDSGGVGIGGRLEKNDVLEIALLLQSEMKKRGHEVLMTRTADTYPTLSERVKLANDWKADVFVAIHRNAYDDAGANGGEVLYGTNASKTSIKLAETANVKINSATAFKNRGAKRQAATVLNNTDMPAVTVELGFITNAGDNSKFDMNKNGIVMAIANAVEEVFGKGVPVEPENDFKYVLNDDVTLWRNAGEGKKGTVVTLDAYPTANEPSGVYARIKDENGNEYLCEWKFLIKK